MLVSNPWDKALTLFAFALTALLAACGGGGGGGGGGGNLPPPSATTPTPMPTSTPGSLTAGWMGGTGFPESGPEVTATFAPGTITGGTSTGAPINFAATSQSATVSLAQSNYVGTFTYNAATGCQGNISISQPISTAFLITDLGTAFSSCAVTFEDALYPSGPAVQFNVTGPVSITGIGN